MGATFSKKSQNGFILSLGYFAAAAAAAAGRKSRWSLRLGIFMSKG